MRITGKSERFARRLLLRIKKYLNKQEHQYITSSDFSEYTGIDKQVIEEFLSD